MNFNLTELFPIPPTRNWSSNLTRVFWLGSNKDMVLIPTILQVFIFILHLQWKKFDKSDAPDVKSFWVGSIWPSRSSLYHVSVLGLSAKIWLGVNLDPMSNRADSTVVDNFRFFMPHWKNFTYLPLGENEFCDVWSHWKLESSFLDQVKWRTAWQYSNNLSFGQFWFDEHSCQ